MRNQPRVVTVNPLNPGFFEFFFKNTELPSIGVGRTSWPDYWISNLELPYTVPA
jgi:hypothetical protein